VIRTSRALADLTTSQLIVRAEDGRGRFTTATVSITYRRFADAALPTFRSFPSALTLGESQSEGSEIATVIANATGPVVLLIAGGKKVVETAIAQLLEHFNQNRRILSSSPSHAGSPL